MSEKRLEFALPILTAMQPGPNIVALDHLQVAIPRHGEDLGRTFYRDILGLEEIPVPAEVAQLAVAWFKVGSQQLHIAVDPDFQPAKKAHPAFVVVNLEEMIQRLLSANVRVVTADSIPGRSRCHVFDPFGNRIELIEYKRPLVADLAS